MMKALRKSSIDDKKTVVVVGKESVGKSQLISSVTGSGAASSGFKGTTVACEEYEGERFRFLDTPGILHDSDTATTKMALDSLNQGETVLLVVSGADLDTDLEDMLPLIRGRRGAIVVTYWDLARNQPSALERLHRLEETIGVRMIAVDARQLGITEIEEIRSALDQPRAFPAALPRWRAGWRITPPENLFDKPVLGPVLALILVGAPPALAVYWAIRLADFLYDPVTALFAPAVERLSQLPGLVGHALAGSYGVVSMGPFLLLYAIPTVAIFALILGSYKASGLIDRITVALDPIMRYFGLTGRDLVRIIMGFGCNVPAVINSRSVSASTRGTCISGICFGSACSYQLPATLAVFSAAGMGYMAFPYLGVLAVTTMVYLRLSTPRHLLNLEGQGKLKLLKRDFVSWPRASAVAREAWMVIRQFFFVALPIFFVICAIASGLDWTGLFDWMTWLIGPSMALFNLPGDAALPVILGAIRKDGIAVGLLDVGQSTLRVGLEPAQVLTVVYLAGVLLPCMVTLLTVIREVSAKFALRLVSKQALAAVVFSLIIAWGGMLLTQVAGPSVAPESSLTAVDAQPSGATLALDGGP